VAVEKQPEQARIVFVVAAFLTVTSISRFGQAIFGNPNFYYVHSPVKACTRIK
jgi:hypothetical protein